MCIQVRLFRSYCLCMYGTALWNTANCMKKLRSCYHRCMKSFFGYDRFSSVTAILSDLLLLLLLLLLRGLNTRYVIRSK